MKGNEKPNKAERQQHSERPTFVLMMMIGPGNARPDKAERQ